MMNRTALFLLLSVLTLFLTGYYLQTSTANPQTIGDFTTSLDIGEVSNPGNALYQPSDQTYTIEGSGHAYLHGISPDNQTVIFTGWRNEKYDLYAADVNTMEETQLTDTPFLDDGSEYSPDGEYIYFNSNRTGAMQLWRMKPDGSEQTQLTFDENFNDWFPHISPDGEWILFISYGTDVASGDHPFYKHVTLRLMPVTGGEPEIVAYLYGGQGTINVPSWSPDSRFVAFVSNSGRFY